eukprot:1465454-Pyramimonas_sp.AAC.1
MQRHRSSDPRRRVEQSVYPLRAREENETLHIGVEEVVVEGQLLASNKAIPGNVAHYVMSHEQRNISCPGRLTLARRGLR